MTDTEIQAMIDMSEPGAPASNMTVDQYRAMVAEISADSDAADAVVDAARGLSTPQLTDLISRLSDILDENNEKENGSAAEREVDTMIEKFKLGY